MVGSRNTTGTVPELKELASSQTEKKTDQKHLKNDSNII